MKLWHVGAAPNPNRVDGVSRTVWLMSVEQARLGHDVSLVLDGTPTPEAHELAGPVGLKLLDLTATSWTYRNEVRALLDAAPPQVVHMHSVFIPRQAALARELRRRGIPYIITPHAGLAPQVLARGRIKKTAYSVLRERPRFMGAAAIALVTPAEEKAIRSYLPNYAGIVRWMPNPVDFAILDPHRWGGLEDPKRLVFLGRFDVLVKGIDILFELARLMPDVHFDLYGTEDPKTRDWLNRLMANQPQNLKFHDPVFGKTKAQILAGASLYIQPSRWEGFPVSVAECMYLGVPSSIADTLDLAHLFEQHDLGLVLSLEPHRAAEQIRGALADPGRMTAWSQRGREFALQHFAPTRVAENHVRLYEEVQQGRSVQQRPIAGDNGHAPTDAPARSTARGMARRLMPPNMRGLLKENVSRAFERSTRDAPASARTVILCYHSIAKNDAALALDPAMFTRHLMELKHLGFRFMSFGDLVQQIMEWGPPPGRVACVTFDDGFEDNFRLAMPILSEHAVTATFFVTSGLAQGDESVIRAFRTLTRYDAPYVSRGQLRQMHDAGFEVAAHTHTHPNLARLSEDRARSEIVTSKSWLEDVIGAPVRSFAYPFGKRHIHYTARTVDLVRESGYRAGASVAFRGVSARSAVRVFEMPRFFVTRADDLAIFRQKIRGNFDWLGSFQELSPRWLKSVISPEDRY